METQQEWKCKSGRHTWWQHPGSHLPVLCFLGVFCWHLLPFYSSVKWEQSQYRFVRRLNLKCDNACGNFFVRCKVLGPSFHLWAWGASSFPTVQMDLCWAANPILSCLSVEPAPSGTFSSAFQPSPTYCQAPCSLVIHLSHVLLPFIVWLCSTSVSLLHESSFLNELLYTPYTPLSNLHISSWLVAVSSFLWNNSQKLPMTNFCRHIPWTFSGLILQDFSGAFTVVTWPLASMTSLSDFP